jgi:hypothetical protein
MARPIIHNDPESEARRAYQREWHRKKRLAEANWNKAERQKYYTENRDARLAYQKVYYEANKAHVNEQYKKWYQANRARPRVRKAKQTGPPPPPQGVKTEPKVVEKHNIKIIHGPVTLLFD